MANEYFKVVSILSHQKMQIKIDLGIHLTPLTKATIKKNMVINADEDVGK